MWDLVRFLLLLIFITVMLQFFNNFKPEIGIKGNIEHIWKGTK